MSLKSEKLKNKIQLCILGMFTFSSRFDWVNFLLICVNMHSKNLSNGRDNYYQSAIVIRQIRAFSSSSYIYNFEFPSHYTSSLCFLKERGSFDIFVSFLIILLNRCGFSSILFFIFFFFTSKLEATPYSGTFQLVSCTQSISDPINRSLDGSVNKMKLSIRGWWS